MRFKISQLFQIWTFLAQNQRFEVNHRFPKIIHQANKYISPKKPFDVPYMVVAQCALFVSTVYLTRCPNVWVEDYLLRKKRHLSPLHVGISLTSALKGTLSGSMSVPLAGESWKSPLIEDRNYN